MQLLATDRCLTRNYGFNGPVECGSLVGSKVLPMTMSPKPACVAPKHLVLE